MALLPVVALAQPLAANKSKFVGNVIGNGFSIREANFKKYWNQVTAENAGKWGSVEFSPGSYSWTQLDNIYNFAKNNGFLYRHHTLVWGNQEPGFIAALDSASQYQEVENWIMAVGQRYPDVDFCDVVNEPLHAPPSYKNALGGDGVTGWDWVIKSFELAREHLSPNTQLHLNEYSVINDGNANGRYIEIINLLQERGLIDGIGVQGHNFEVNGGASTTTLRNNLTNLAATGLPIYITEFDINQSDDNVQLQRYQAIFPVLFEHPGVYGITLWGYVQFEIWQQNAYLVTDPRLAERPAMQWLRTYLASPFRPLLVSPNGTTEEPRNPLLVWHPAESATSYTIEVATNSTFTSIVLDSTVADTSLLVIPLAANTQFYWRVTASNEHGSSAFSTTATFTTGQITSVEESAEIPSEFELSQNYPNPFNPSTTLHYTIGSPQHVRLTIYDILGNEVTTLVDERKAAGQYRVTFDANGLASGVYLIRLSAGPFVAMKKAILVR
jgi:GH35 family endo-1,4-beta-xylanase